jgi:hypothetical protein
VAFSVRLSVIETFCVKSWRLSATEFDVQNGKYFETAFVNKNGVCVTWPSNLTHW